MLRLRGDPGGEKVGDGDDGVGGSAVSFQSRCVLSLRPSAAARVSRSSSAACSCGGFSSSGSVFCRFGVSGGDIVGDAAVAVAHDVAAAHAKRAARHAVRRHRAKVNRRARVDVHFGKAEW